MDLNYVHEGLMALSASYNVNPYIFAAIYVGAIPFFTISVAWLVRNKKRERSLTLPIVSTGFFFSLSHVYLLVAGENVPLWVYGLILGILGVGIHVMFTRVLSKTARANSGERGNDNILKR